MTAEEAALIESYLSGSASALKTINAWILPVVRHRAWGRSHQEDDLLQDIRLRLLKLFEGKSFRGESSLKTYVRATAKYTCLDAVRRARVRETEEFQEEQFPSWSDNPVEALEGKESARMCYRVLWALPEPCRALFKMVLEQHMNYESMAEELSVAVGTVKSRLARCRDRAVALRSQFATPRATEQDAP